MFYVHNETLTCTVSAQCHVWHARDLSSSWNTLL